jgi:hypothetical protein
MSLWIKNKGEPGPHRPPERLGELRVEDVLVVAHGQLVVLLRLGQEGHHGLDVGPGVVVEGGADEPHAAIVQVVVAADVAQHARSYQEIVFHLHAPRHAQVLQRGVHQVQQVPLSVRGGGGERERT